MPSVTNYHKPGGLTQHTCMLLQFWRQEVWHQLHRANVQVWAELALCGGSKGDSVSLPFSASGDIYIPWLVAPSSNCKASHSCFCLCCHRDSLFFNFLASSYKDPGDDTEVSFRRISSQNPEPNLSSSFCHIRYHSQVLRTRTASLWKAIIQLITLVSWNQGFFEK